jgi:hypothetical protein
MAIAYEKKVLSLPFSSGSRNRSRAQSEDPKICSHQIRSESKAAEVQTAGELPVSEQLRFLVFGHMKIVNEMIM